MPIRPCDVKEPGLVRGRASGHSGTMPRPSDPTTAKRLAAQLRANMARRKAVEREREADPDASSLTFRDAPVHDPALRTGKREE
jgi:hypothetical protein